MKHPQSIADNLFRRGITALGCNSFLEAVSLLTGLSLLIWALMGIAGMFDG